MNRSTRRTFLKRTLAAAATITIAGTKSSGRVLGANDAIRIGVAGLNGRGKDHVKAFADMKGVQITHLIDPDTRAFAAGIKDKSDGSTKSLVEYVKAKCGSKPKTEQDVRHALDGKQLDAITIATPNHWHALMTIWACRAGKDVYVEKPCCHNLVEGNLAASFARRRERIVQHGTQNRSNPHWAKVAAIVQSGKLGKLLVSRGLCYKPRGPIGNKPTEAAPADLDFNLWLGPAADRPFHKNLVHYNWHWFWDFGNGDIGNQGVHQMDIARWMIPNARGPKSVMSLGGRFGVPDQGETPNTQIAIFEFPAITTKLVFEVRGLPTDAFDGEKVGNTLHFEEGTIIGDAGGKIRFIPKGKTDPEPLPDFDVKFNAERFTGNHFANFISCVRSRKFDDLTADILQEGFYSSALCLLANASYRVGEMAPFNQKANAFGDDREAFDTFARMDAHLQKNKIPLDGQSYRLGKKLKYNPDTENVYEPAARKILCGTYRKGFELPEIALG